MSAYSLTLVSNEMTEQRDYYAPSRRWRHRVLAALGVADAMASAAAAGTPGAQTTEANESETQRYNLFEMVVRGGVHSADACSGQSNRYFAPRERVVEFDGTSLASTRDFWIAATTYHERDEHESLRYRTHLELDRLDIVVDDEGAIVDSNAIGSYWVESTYTNFDEELVETTVSETRVIDGVSLFSQVGNELHVRLAASDDHCPTSAQDVVVLILREENPSPPRPLGGSGEATLPR